jgi:hypothetical protein
MPSHITQLTQGQHDVDASEVRHLRLGYAFERERIDQEGQAHYYQPRTLKHVTYTLPASL